MVIDVDYKGVSLITTSNLEDYIDKVQAEINSLRAQLAALHEENERLKAELTTANSCYGAQLMATEDAHKYLRKSEKENDSLRAQLAEMQKPVTREEIEAIIGPDTLPGDAAFRLASLAMADKLIASRHPKHDPSCNCTTTKASTGHYPKHDPNCSCLIRGE